METPFFQICTNDETLKRLLGDNPVRIYPDEAPQNVQVPYVVYQWVGGSPENDLLGAVYDRIRIQVDVYANSIKERELVTREIRHAQLPKKNPDYWLGKNTVYY